MSSSKRSLLKKNGTYAIIEGPIGQFRFLIKSRAQPRYEFHILSAMLQLVFSKNTLNLGFLSWNYEDCF
jgi:hypothetical protein